MNYSRLAPFYQCIEKCTMGTALQRARTEQLGYLAGLASPQRVLIVGEGDGSFLITFVRQFPQAAITVVEPSAGMVARAQARLLKEGLSSAQIVFHVEPLLEAALPQASFDLIVTLFFFDNFEETEVGECLTKLKGFAAGDAYWLLSDFCLPRSGWRRVRAQIWLKILYIFFRAATGLRARELPDVERLMEAEGLRPIKRKVLCGGMLYASLYR